MGVIEIASKDRKHFFPIIFYSRHVQMENSHIFDVYPVDWETEIVQGRTELFGNGNLKLNLTRTFRDITTELAPEPDIYLYLNVHHKPAITFGYYIAVSASATIKTE